MTTDDRPVILVVGDSFTAGQGCSDRDTTIYDFPMLPSEFAWSALLAKDYPGYNVINLAKPGASNTNISNQVYEYVNSRLNKKPNLVLFCGSWDNRILIQSDPLTAPSFGNVTNVTDWVMPAKIPVQSKDYATAKEMFLKYLYVSDFFASVSLLSIWSIYGLCKNLDINFAWSYPAGENANNNGYLGQLEFCKYEAISDWIVASRQGKNKIYEASDGHANNLGHMCYYDAIIKKLLVNQKI